MRRESGSGMDFLLAKSSAVICLDHVKSEDVVVNNFCACCADLEAVWRTALPTMSREEGFMVRVAIVYACIYPEAAVKIVECVGTGAVRKGGVCNVTKKLNCEGTLDVCFVRDVSVAGNGCGTNDQRQVKITKMRLVDESQCLLDQRQGWTSLGAVWAMLNTFTMGIL